MLLGNFVKKPFTINDYITNLQRDQLPVGLIAQLVEHCTGIAEVMGFKSRSSLTFFGLYFHNCLSCVYNCDDQSCLRLSVKAKTLGSNEFLVSEEQVVVVFIAKVQHVKSTINFSFKCLRLQASSVMLLYVVNVIHHDNMKRFTKLKEKTKNMYGMDSETPASTPPPPPPPLEPPLPSVGTHQEYGHNNVITLSK